MTYIPVYTFYNLSKSVGPFTFDNLSKNDGTSSFYDWDTGPCGYVFIDAIFSELVLFLRACALTHYVIFTFYFKSIKWRVSQACETTIEVEVALQEIHTKPDTRQINYVKITKTCTR